MKREKGFTIIELLIVIAIIGILSSIILASVNLARSKGQDGAAKADLGGVRAQASLFNDENNQSYGAADVGCDRTDGSIFDPGVENNVTALIISAQTHLGGSPAITCANDDINYVIGIALNSGDTWCVDGTGYAGISTKIPEDLETDLACQ